MYVTAPSKPAVLVTGDDQGIEPVLLHRSPHVRVPTLELDR